MKARKEEIADVGGRSKDFSYEGSYGETLVRNVIAQTEDINITHGHRLHRACLRRF